MPICMLAFQSKLTKGLSMSNLKADIPEKDMVAQALSEAHQKDDPMHLFVCEYEPISSGLAARIKKIGNKIA